MDGCGHGQTGAYASGLPEALSSSSDATLLLAGGCLFPVQARSSPFTRRVRWLPRPAAATDAEARLRSPLAAARRRQRSLPTLPSPAVLAELLAGPPIEPASNGLPPIFALHEPPAAAADADDNQTPRSTARSYDPRRLPVLSAESLCVFLRHCYGRSLEPGPTLVRGCAAVGCAAEEAGAAVLLASLTADCPQISLPLPLRPRWASSWTPPCGWAAARRRPRSTAT